MSAEPAATRQEAATRPADRRLPPVAEVAVAALICVVTGGVYLAANLPHPPPLAPAVGLLAAAAVLVVANIVTLVRLRDFAWPTFFQVGRWTLLVYVIVAGMLEYVFLYDGTRGAVLGVLTGMLVVFAVDIPTILAFTVARFQDVPGNREKATGG